MLNKLLHLSGCTLLILHNLYLGVCALVEQTNYTFLFWVELGVIEMEPNLVLN